LKALNVPREDLVVSTKIFWGPGTDKSQNNQGLSRKHIIEAMKNSLKRLDLDYVDLVFCHRFDIHTPLEDVCRAFTDII